MAKYLFLKNDGNDESIKESDSLDELKKVAAKEWEGLNSDEKEALADFCIIESDEPEPSGEQHLEGTVLWAPIYPGLNYGRG